eukprot:168636-Rhodomonas_salina.2
MCSPPEKHRQSDMLEHSMMHCPEIKEAHNCMHDDIASTLIQSITVTSALSGTKTGHMVQVVTPHTASRIDQLWPVDCPESIADIVPDCIIIVNSPKGCKIKTHIIIVEFARCYSIIIGELGDLEDTAASKDMQYHSTTQFLTNKFPGHMVRCHIFIMSVFGTIPQDSWPAYFEEAGLTDAKSQRIQHDGISSCIIAGHGLHNTYRSRRMEVPRCSGTDPSTPSPVASTALASDEYPFTTAPHSAARKSSSLAVHHPIGPVHASPNKAPYHDITRECSLGVQLLVNAASTVVLVGNRDTGGLVQWAVTLTLAVTQ